MTLRVTFHPDSYDSAVRQLEAVGLHVVRQDSDGAQYVLGWIVPEPMDGITALFGEAEGYKKLLGTVNKVKGVLGMHDYVEVALEVTDRSWPYIQKIIGRVVKDAEHA